MYIICIYFLNKTKQKKIKWFYKNVKNRSKWEWDMNKRENDRKKPNYNNQLKFYQAAKLYWFVETTNE